MYYQRLLPFALTLLSFHILFQGCVALPQLTSISTPQTNTADPQTQPNDHGLQLTPGGCTGTQLSAMETAIHDANLLAEAALVAASNFTEPPFNYFFQGDIETANTVAGVLRRAQSALQQKGETFNATCTDTYRQCPVSIEHMRLGYVAHTTPPLLVLCFLGLSLPRNPPPCTAIPGTVSLGFTMLHELMHIRSISGPGRRIHDLTRRTAREVQDALKAGRNTTLDANAYSYLGSMAWDLGLGVKASGQGETCLQNFTRGNFDGAEEAGLRASVGLDGLRL